MNAWPTQPVSGKCSADWYFSSAMAYSKNRSSRMQMPTMRMTASTKYPCHIVEP